MYSDSRKIDLIEAMLKVDDEIVLAKLETLLKRSKKATKSKISIYDFVGAFTHKETKEMRKVIEETCEIINPNDWK